VGGGFCFLGGFGGGVCVVGVVFFLGVVLGGIGEARDSGYFSVLLLSPPQFHKKAQPDPPFTHLYV